MGNKAEYKNRHFHDFSIIATEKDLNDEYALHMINYYSEQHRNNPELPPYRQRFITFMIYNDYERMKT
eukprot:2124627-Amphidinium_carterae.1